MPHAQELLRGAERDYVGACGRFLSREPSRDSIWTLGGNGDISAIVINSKSAVIPVLCANKDIPRPEFLSGFLRLKKIHSVQGIKNEVIFMEDEMRRIGRNASDIIDYDLMETDSLPLQNRLSSGPQGLLLYTPRLVDIDMIAPLQAAYEKEEVIPSGSFFSPAASRVNITNIIAGGKILAAELKGKIIGKINVSAVSFTRYQIGGVYVHPDYRGRGVAARMAAEFTASLIKEGMGITLYVKKNNIAARRLYSSLGFTVRNDYRITYY